MKVELHREVLRYLARLAVEAPRDKDRCVRAIERKIPITVDLR